MSSQLKERAKALFNYLDEVVRLGTKIYRTVDEHDDGFILYEKDLPRCEEISPPTRPDGEGAWLSIRRPTIPDPPIIPSPLQGYVEISNDPEKLPEVSNLFASERQTRCESLLQQYLTEWKSWAEQAIVKKRTQKLFNALYKVNERLKYEEQLELIWGHGILLWTDGTASIKYPLITQRMIIQHEAREHTLRVTPADDAEPRLELHLLSDLKFSDVSDVSKRFASELREVVETEAYGTSYPLQGLVHILQELAGRLSPEGEFVESPEPFELKPSENLKIVDSWVLFLRKRQQDAILHDIENFRKQLDGRDTELPRPLAAFLSNPKKESPKRRDPEITDEWDILLDKKVLFPLPASEEQVQILKNCFKTYLFADRWECRAKQGGDAMAF